MRDADSSQPPTPADETRSSRPDGAAPPVVPLHRAAVVGRELEHVTAAIRSARIGGGGPYGERCAARLAELCDGARVLVTKSCTAALEIMAMLLDLEPGDEVVLPSFAYVTTANAFAMRGARIAFADVRPDTLTIDPRSVRDLVTSRTRAIVALHYAGVACAMDELLTLGDELGIPVVEDNAHGLGGRWRGRALGALGPMSATSFHETKAVTCGEGGALVLRDAAHLARAEVIHAKGTDRRRYERGEVGRYTWQDLGSSCMLSEIDAAFLWGQLEQLDRIAAVRAGQWQRYARELAPWAATQGARLPVVPPDCESSHQLFHVLLPDHDARERLAAHLGRHGIRSAFHFLPLHRSPMGQRFAAAPGVCPVTEDASARLLRLPLFHDMTDAEQGRVVDAVRAFRA